VKRRRTVYGEHYRQALQRALHRWPGFEESIFEARQRLGYEVAWWNRDDLAWDGLPPQPPYWEFVTTRGREVEAAAEAAITALHLPSQQHLDKLARRDWSLLAYWLAAFYSYRPPSLASVEDFGPLGRDLPDVVRAYPRWSSDTVEVTADEVRIVAPMELVTRESLHRAADRAWDLVKLRRGRTVHRLVRTRAALPGVVARMQELGPRDRMILRLRNERLTIEEIAELTGRDVDSVEEIVRCRRGGPLTVAQIAELVDVGDDAVRRTFRRVRGNA
jgi:hypothetical protein